MTCAVHPNIPAFAYCRTCGKALCESCKRDVKGVIFCQDCLAARLEGAVPAGAALPPGTVVPPPPLPEGTPNPAVALVLGFIPGVGAFYNGQFAKGFIHVVIFAILIKLTDVSGMFGVMIAAWYFYMIFDAYKTAKARQLGLPLPDPLGLNNLFGIQELTAGPPTNTPASGGTTPLPPAPAYTPTTPQYAPSYTQRRAPVAAIFLIGFGVLFLLDNLGFFHWYWAGRYWPVILIILGLWIAAKRSAEARAVQEQRSATAQHTESSSEANHG
jgi:TM2 domain-containing membrane protein YozV